MREIDGVEYRVSSLTLALVPKPPPELTSVLVLGLGPERNEAREGCRTRSSTPSSYCTLSSGCVFQEGEFPANEFAINGPGAY